MKCHICKKEKSNKHRILPVGWIAIYNYKTGKEIYYCNICRPDKIVNK